MDHEFNCKVGRHSFISCCCLHARFCVWCNFQEPTAMRAISQADPDIYWEYEGPSLRRPTWQAPGHGPKRVNFNYAAVREWAADTWD